MKYFIRYTIAFFAVLLASPHTVQSQNYQDPDKALRYMLGSLDWNPVSTYSSPPIATSTPEFLYDYSTNVTDFKYFVPVSNDISTIDNFFLMYEEMWNAADDTTIWERSDSLAKRALQISSDTTQILTFNFDFLKIKEVAYTNGDYFTFNTTQNRLEDHPNPIGDPFELGEVYAATSSKTSHNFTDVHYRIDPAFMIFDQRNSLKDQNPEYGLRIDFGDGNGFINFDPTAITTHTVNFPEKGSYVITVELAQGGSVINRSKFKTHILSGNQTVPPDHCVDLNGLEACFYDGCSDGSQAPEDKKFVIYLEGIDILDFLPGMNRNADDIYSDMIQGENLAELRNFGYNFVIVDWKNSRRDMRQNAMYVAQLIDYIKCTYPNEHEIVLMGESMGGVVGRYALAYMESEEYTSGNQPWGGEPCFPELMHKTRLFISLDAPHQGANIPLSLQEFYKHITDGLIRGVIGKVIAAPVRIILEDISNVGLGSDAAQQLLLYHADTKNGFCGTSNDYCYTAHSEREDFMNDLEALGDYPQYCKLMALSNGSLDGNKQTRSYNTADRLPSDKILDFNGEIYGRVLHFIKIPVFGAELDLRTNPQGNGKLYEAAMGTWGIDIDVYFIGIRVKVGLISMANKEVYGQGLNSYGTNAGGLIRFGGLEPDANGFTDNNEGWPGPDFPMFKYSSVNDGNGHYSFVAEAGIPWVAQVGASLDLYSDGAHFGFIPIKSALDWEDVERQPLSPDIEGTAWPAKVNNSPFDVIAGIHSSRPNNHQSFAYTNNKHHVNIENQWIPGEEFVTCQPSDEFRVYVLNREIGDEKIYLNNRTMAWSALIEAEKDIFVNDGDNNPHYDHEFKAAVLPPRWEGFYSKGNPYAMLPNNPVGGQPVLLSLESENDPTISPDGEPGPIDFQNIPLPVCCFTSGQYRVASPNGGNSSFVTENRGKESEGGASSENDEITLDKGDSGWFIYPNPTKSRLVLANTLPDAREVMIRLSDISGKIVYEEQFTASPQMAKEINVSRFDAGLYYLTLSESGTTVSKQKIVLQ